MLLSILFHKDERLPPIGTVRNDGRFLSLVKAYKFECQNTRSLVNRLEGLNLPLKHSSKSNDSHTKSQFLPVKLYSQSHFGCHDRVDVLYQRTNDPVNAHLRSGICNLN